MPSLDPVSEIKSRLQIQDVVASYVSLKPAGRNFKGLCPFHHEKTPSFHVSVERQIAYCFGCHKGGDLFSFIQEVDGIDFKEALKLLADRAGIPLESKWASPEQVKATKDHKQTLISINEEVGRFYQDQLFSTAEGTHVLRYLEERGIKPAAIQTFQLGYAPDSFEATSSHLFQKKCSKKDLLELGLLMSKDTTAERVFDRFRGRLMFPIHDLQGKLVGFGGRALKPDEPSKYMNSPDSSLYHKSELLYGLNHAKTAIREAKLAIVVEGYMDVIASHQAGVCPVVASSGTALTIEQLKLLSRFASRIAFAFDTDEAGEQALNRAVELGQTLNVQMNVVRVPEGKDPDECIRHNPEVWKQAIEAAPSYLDYYLDQLPKRFDLEKPEGKREACRFFFPFLARVSAIERDHALVQLGFLFKTDSRVLYDELNAFTKNTKSSSKRLSSSLSQNSSFPIEKSHSSSYSPMDYFVGKLLLSHSYFSELSPQVFSLSEALFQDPIKRIYKTLSSQYNIQASIDLDRVLAELDESEKAYVDRLMLFVEIQSEGFSHEQTLKELESTTAHLLKLTREQSASQLLHQIRLAQNVQDKALEQKLFQDYSHLFQTSA